MAFYCFLSLMAGLSIGFGFGREAQSKMWQSLLNRVFGLEWDDERT